MTGNFTSYKTKNQIFNDFISIASNALEFFSVTGWQIRQLNQVFKTNSLKPTIFISIISNKQAGSQYRSNVISDDTYIKSNSTKKEIHIRFSAAYRELTSDTLETLNSTDVLEYIKQYMQGADGIAALSNLGYAQYRSTDITEQSFINDSEDFEFMPYFDCTFLYTNSWTRIINQLTQAKEQGLYKI